MNEFIVKLRMLARAEVTLFKADAARRTNQALLAAISIGCLFVGLVFVNMGIFFMLTESDLDARAAFILAAGNIGLALVPMLLRRNAKPGPEEAMIREIREMAAAEISKDISGISDDFGALADSVKQVKSGISSFSGSGHGAIGMLAPVLPLVIDLLKKGKK
jgi:hypothetical protein